ncbi:hypothetical protein [Microvirga arabica]|uniref:hypothetical protein n=1 Tax=Microvirga arabica TaxID=1128671 RepID=UPI0019398F67|nr:hypothetical protein [Microvirga arabica]MBM1173017.1 hypothetical protein [Microvirga arabica]
MNACKSHIIAPSFLKLAKMLETDKYNFEIDILLKAFKIAIRSYPQLVLVDDDELYIKLELLSEDLLETIDILRLDLCSAGDIDKVFDLFLARSDYILRPRAA